MNEKQKAEFLKLAEKTIEAGKSVMQKEESVLEPLYDVPVSVTAVLGKTVMPIHELLKLGPGAVIELDKHVGDSIDIYVNNRLIAKGELVSQGDRLGITMTEIVKA